MSVTLSDVAKEAGVCVGTVNRVLKNSPKVSKETRNIVIAAVRKLNYVSKSASKKLLDIYDNVKIATIIPDIESNDFNKMIAKGIDTEARVYKKYGCLLEVNSYKFGCESELIDRIDKLDKDINGLIIKGMNTPSVAQKLNQLVDKGVSVVCLSVFIDNVKSIFISNSHSKGGKVIGNIIEILSDGDRNCLLVTSSKKNEKHMQLVESFSQYLESNVPSCNLIGMIESFAQGVSVRGAIDYYRAKHKIDFLLLHVMKDKQLEDLLNQPKDKEMKIIVVGYKEKHSKYLEDGKIDILIDCNPYMQGNKALQFLYETLILNNGENEENIDIPYSVVLKEMI